MKMVRVEDLRNSIRHQRQPLDLIEAGLSCVQAGVSYAERRSRTHTVVQVAGLESTLVTAGLGRVLAGVLAGAVKIDTSLASALLLKGVDERKELADCVERLLGASNAFHSKGAILFRDTKRNAWLAEGVLHVLLIAQNRQPSVLLRGQVHALRNIHPGPTQQGLDAVALFLSGGELMIAVGESKASREDGSGALTESAKIFRSIDAGEHMLHLRQELSALSESLPHDLAGGVSRAVLDRRCYVPSIVHEVEFNALTDRDVFGRLHPPLNQRRVLVMKLKDFHRFFDDVADAVRAAIPEVVI